MFGSFDISASALTAQRIRVESIASNMANAGSLGKFDAELGRNIPYRRQVVDFQPVHLGDGRIGVGVSQVRFETGEVKMYEPGNTKYADKNGFVYYPDVNLSTEIVDGMEARQAYEANITAIETTKAMLNATLRIMA
jgi:flagellar basal-body rod protein FlgC